MTDTLSDFDGTDAELEDLLSVCVQASDPEADLERLVASRPDLRDRARRILLRLQEDKAATLAAQIEPEDDRPEIPGFRVLSELGRGGMGVVYLADQREPVKRRVALKVIKRGMDSQEVLRRFELERQALAVMNHDSIARVYDAGTTVQGQPYFVMEFVAGVPLTEHCDKFYLSTRERLELFGLVCAGVQHAHQKGIIHRDLKPSNILVSVDQGKAVPKIIDFGLARATDQRLTEGTLFTEQGQILGTPTYISPEQAEMSTQELDTRTDIYSLGVVLYELLTGQLPFSGAELQRAGLFEMQRMLLNEDPPKPSMRISSLGDESKSATKLRKTTLSALTKDLRGDLDWVVMKAIEKDRNRRYGTANELAGDVERFLKDEPVTAAAPSATYRIRKFVRRYRLQVGAAVAVLIALITGLAGTTWFMFDARAQRTIADAKTKEAREQRGIAEEKTAEVSEQKARADREATEATRQRRLADQRAYAANVYAVAAGLDRGDTTEAKRRLRMCPEQYRGWEWHHLTLRADQSRKSLGTRGAAWDVEPDPNGKRIVICGPPEPRLIDSETGKTLRTFKGSEWLTRDAAFSANGRWLAAGGDADILCVWEVETGKRLHAIKTPGSIHQVTWDPQGRWLAVGHRKGVDLFDANSGEHVRTFDKRSRCAFSASGDALLVCVRSRDLEIWNTETWKLFRRVGLQRDFESNSVVQIACSPKGHYAAVSLAGGAIILLDLRSGAQAARWQPRTFSAGSLAFSADDQALAIGFADKAIRVYGVQDLCDPSRTGADGKMSLRSTLAGHEGQVSGLSFARDGTLVSISTDDTVKFWHTKTRGAVHRITGRNWVRDVVVGRKSSLAFCAAGSVVVRDLKSGSISMELKTARTERGGSSGIPRARCVALAPQEDRIAVGYSDATVRVWDLAKAEVVFELRHENWNVRCVAWSADGRVIASGGVESVRLWDAKSGKLTAEFDEQGHYQTLAFHPKASILGSSGDDLNVRLWDVTRKKVANSFKTKNYTKCLAYSPDGAFMVRSQSTTLVIHDAATFATLRVLRGHEQDVTDVAYSPDGKRIVSCADDLTMRVWDPVTGECLYTSHLATERPACVAFSPDGKRILMGGRDSTLRIFESDRAQALEFWAAQPDAETK